ncbi:Actin-like protein arp9 (SWI/SNF complex component arp9) [Orbilia ellipsospora]|uniref:Actin-like protein arp9 (SWI/SNF complex component arp9) n=1 Tax=Orbilia ellipsospora TaxID=2528407 RepID=A0AAV9XN36_9PEZI
MPPFRDDHILLIAPGSTWTLAQLGLPESFTPAKVRIPSRMFPGIEEGHYLPNKVHEVTEGQELMLGNGEVVTAGPNGKPYKKRKVGESASKPSATATNGGAADGGAAGAEDSKKPIDTKGDTTMADATDEKEHHDEDHEEEGHDDDEDHEMNGTKDKASNGKIYYDDDFDEEGAIWCMEQGRIVNWECFFALLLHVHEHINPTFHTPILMISQPSWTCTDKERICQFIFEKIKAPGFCMMDAAAAISAAYSAQSSLIIDVGYEKTDITAIIDYNVQELGRTTIPEGGNSMNKHLQKLLPHLSEDEIEQLKHSSICEILPPGIPIPGEEDSDKDTIMRPPDIGAIGMGGPLPPKAPEEEANEEEEEGVTNIAAIVASGKTQEYLAKKEKEKADKKAGLGLGEKRLPNYKREKNTFSYLEKLADQSTGPTKPDQAIEVPDGEHMDVDPAPATEEPQPSENIENATVPTEGDAAPAAPSSEDPLKVNPEAPPKPAGPSLMESMFSGTKDDDEAKKAQEKALRREEKKRQEAAQSGEKRREVEVGTERFKVAEGGILEAIADAAHRVVSSADDYNQRNDCWKSLIIAGNGSRVRGFKDALLNTMIAKYQVSPSTGTIFTSELPSNIPTPSGTGTNTPQPSSFNTQPNALLLQAAANNAAAAALAQHHPSIPQANQSPSEMKIAKIPEYFPEWKDAGFEECVFLGAQLGAKIYFVTDQGANKGFVTRADYNMQGPQAIHNI